MSKPFKFKQFSIEQDRCAMKIGTDSVILGAWANIKKQPKQILDIGSGTGILALMLAQRSSAENIEALDIDEEAYEQCVDNFESSPWADRLFCYHAGLDEFVDDLEDRYNLIVSNPPFYSEVVSSGNISRDIARQNQSLPFNELFEGVSKLLDKDGIFASVAPFKEEKKIIKIAQIFKLFPLRILRVKGNDSSPIKRSFIEFTFTKTDTKIEELIIEKERHQYTNDYKKLTKDFYLKM